MAVACGWVLIGSIAGLHVNLGRSLFVAVTAPAALLGREMPLGMASAVLLNGCLYALGGAAVELGRRALLRIP
jgi:hypothetical protein